MKLNEKEKVEFNQERMCEICENMILNCISSTSLFQCEGCACDEAEVMYIEEIIEERLERREDNIDKLLNN